MALKAVNKTKSSGDISMSCQLWDQTVVLPLPLLPRGWEICTVTVNISRCGWSLSSFYCWNMVWSVVLWRGVSNGRMPKLFFNPIFLSVLQLVHPSPCTPSAVSRVCLPNKSIPTQNWSLWRNTALPQFWGFGKRCLLEVREISSCLMYFWNYNEPNFTFLKQGHGENTLKGRINKLDFD